MKRLLPALSLSSTVLAVCTAPYPDGYYNDCYYDHYEHDYDRCDDYRYHDGKYYDDDYIEHRAYSNPSLEQKCAQIMQILERRGYRVHEIEADDHRGHPILKTEAFRNGREYDIVFSWPDLRIISRRIDYQPVPPHAARTNSVWCSSFQTVLFIEKVV